MYKIKDIIKFVIAYVWSIGLKKKDIWIVTERRTECKDNGYYFFKYMREKFPDKQVYYAIDKDSSHIVKIEPYQNILYFNSLKHYAYALAATKLIGAFLPVGIPDSICFYKFAKLIKGKKIFLQHGITKENINSLHYENTKVSLFICGGEPEAEFVKKEFGYPEGSVQYTGFCRYDGLINDTKKGFILFMPTWRQWLPSTTFNADEIGFETSFYYKKVRNLLEQPRLKTLLEKNNLEFIFYLHHELQPYLESFSDVGGTRVFVASEKEYDVQKLLIDCNLLITDYSSVQFDVAYMKKPIIYYQFDEEEYYKKHYSRGYFSYISDGFGKKCSNEHEVVAEMENTIDSGFIMEDFYQERVEKFFKYRDKDNCQRVYGAINDIR